MIVGGGGGGDEWNLRQFYHDADCRRSVVGKTEHMPRRALPFFLKGNIVSARRP